MKHKIAIVIDQYLNIGSFYKSAIDDDQHEAILLEPKGLFALIGRNEPLAGLLVESHIPHDQELSFEETEDSTFTGVVLIKRVQQKFPSLPILFLWEYELDNRLNGLNNIILVRKVESVPKKIARLMKMTIGNSPV